MCSMYCCFTAASCIASSSFPDNPATLFFPILEAASSRLSHSPASSKPRHTALSLSSLVSRLSFFLCHSVSLDSLFQNLQGQVCFYRYTIHFTRNPKSQESASFSSSQNVTMPPLPDSDNPNIEKTDLSFLCLSLSICLCLSSLDSLSSKSSNVRFASTVIWFTSKRNPEAHQSSSSLFFASLSSSHIATTKIPPLPDSNNNPDIEENSFSSAERSKKQRLVVSVRGNTKQAKAAVLAGLLCRL